jgi:adenylate kinase family enzyme
MKISDLAELKVTINQLKNKARRERAKARKQAHKERMEAYKEQSAKCVDIYSQHERIFEICKPERNAKKFRNNASSQEMGTCKPYTTTKRYGSTTITIRTTKIY